MGRVFFYWGVEREWFCFATKLQEQGFDIQTKDFDTLAKSFDNQTQLLDTQTKDFDKLVVTEKVNLVDSRHGMVNNHQRKLPNSFGS